MYMDMCIAVHVHVHVLETHMYMMSPPPPPPPPHTHTHTHTHSLLPSCLMIASTVPGSVYRVCDLFSALMRRNGAEWRAMAIAKVRHQVRAAVVDLSNKIEGGQSISSMYEKVILVTANLIHLLVLVMEVQCVCVCVCVSVCVCPSACLLPVCLPVCLPVSVAATLLTATPSSPSSPPPGDSLPVCGGGV